MTACILKLGPCQCQPGEGTPCTQGTPAQVQAAFTAESIALKEQVRVLRDALETKMAAYADAARSEEQAKWRTLVNAVVATYGGPVCNDVAGQNWFDARKVAMKGVSP